MNKRGTWLVSATVLLILMWYWLQHKEPANNQVINVISQTENNSKNHDQSAVVANQITEQNTATKTIEPAVLIAATKERTFMAVYRDLNLAESCSHFYIFDHQSEGNYDYLTPLHAAANYNRGGDGGAPAIQIEALERFYDACLNLKHAVFKRSGITEDYPNYDFAYPVIVELRKEWRQTQPVTTAEKQLAQAVMYSTRWQKSMNELNQISMGEFALSHQEREEIRQQVIKISNEIEQLYLQTDEVDQVAVDLLKKQINTLNINKNQRLNVDAAVRQDALAQFMSITNQLRRHLYTGNPDSFYETIKALELDDNFNLTSADKYSKSQLQAFKQNTPEYLPPSRHLFELSGMVDVAIYNMLIEPASLLFMCYLGDDCGLDSRHSRKYCLGENEHQNSYPEACNKSLVDFYTDDYLSPNQWQDVQELFNLMVTTYAP